MLPQWESIRTIFGVIVCIEIEAGDMHQICADTRWQDRNYGTSSTACSSDFFYNQEKVHSLTVKPCLGENFWLEDLCRLLRSWNGQAHSHAMHKEGDDMIWSASRFSDPPRKRKTLSAQAHEWNISYCILWSLLELITSTPQLKFGRFYLFRRLGIPEKYFK